MSYQVIEKVTMLPAVPGSENGENAAHCVRSVFDGLGRLLWEKSPRGFITRYEYDMASNLLTRRIEDVDIAAWNTSGGGASAPAGWQTPSGGGLHLEYLYQYDRQGRMTKEIGPWHDVQLTAGSTQTSSVRTVRFSLYLDAVRERRTAVGYAVGSGNLLWFTTGWVSISVMDAAGRVVSEIEAVRESNTGDLSSGESFPRSSWRRWRKTGYDLWGSPGWSRVYHLIPGSGDGVAGTHYTETLYGYDVMDRQNRVLDPSGTISRTVFDARGLVTERWMGTDDSGATDSDPSGSGSGANNMRKVESLVYDGGAAGGPGLLSRQDRHVDASTIRSEYFRYDEFDRLQEHQQGDGDSAVTERYEYDLQNRVVRTSRYHGTAADSAKCLSQQDRQFDSRGMVFREVGYSAANPSQNSSPPGLVSERWFDASGNTVKAKGPGSDSTQKIVYDGMDRGIARYVVLEQIPVPPGSGSGGSEGSSASSSSSSASPSSSSSSGGGGGSSSSSESPNFLVLDPFLPPAPFFGGPVFSDSSSGSSGGTPGGGSSGTSGSSSGTIPEDDDDIDTSTGSGGSGGPVSFSSGGNTPVAESPCPCSCDCEDGDPAAPCDRDQSGTKGSAGPSAPVTESSGPVRYATGQISHEEHDLSSSGMSFRWGVTRRYSNLTEEGSGLFGRGWYVEELPVLAFEGAGTGNPTRVAVMTGGSRNRWFEPDPAHSGEYVSMFGGQERLVREPAAKRWVLYTRTGSQLIFFDRHVDTEPKVWGCLWAMKNRLGEEVRIKWRADGTGSPESVTWLTVTAITPARSASYHYEVWDSSQGPGSTGRIRSVTSRVDGQDVERALYTYWNDGQPGGHGGCLRRVTIEHWNPGLSQWEQVRENYYRYYEPGDEDGPAGALKYVFGPEGVAKMQEVFPNTWETMADAIPLRPYASHRFTYDSQRRVRRERVHGYAEVHEFAWLKHTPEPGLSSPNTWHTRTIETLPDGNTVTVLSNAAGLTLLRVLTETATGRSWPQAWRYHTDGRLMETVSPSAIESFSIPQQATDAWSAIGQDSALKLRSTGPVVSYSFYSTADAPGRFKGTSLRTGESGTPVVLTERTYAKRQVSGNHFITPVATEKVYRAPGVFSETDYRHTYAGGPAVGSMAVPVDIEYPLANHVSADTVYQQEKPQFDAAGNLLLATRWVRRHDTSASSAGELQAPDAAVGPRAIRSYSAAWPDAVGRVHSAADYGTNAGNALTRPAICPPASDMVRVTRTRFLEGAVPWETVAPDGTVTRSESDHAGRRTRLTENVLTSPPSTDLSANRVTEYAYHSSGQLAILTAKNRKLSGGTVVTEDQVTRWAFGTTLTDCGIATGHLLRAKLYPDTDDTISGTGVPGNGADGVYKRVEYCYNRLAEVTSMKDPSGTVHDYSYDQHGRLLHDSVSTLATGLDGTVRRISRTYDAAGRWTRVASWDKAVSDGSAVVVNELKLETNSWGQLTADRQAHSAAVDAPSPAVPVGVVGYAYADGSANHLRRTGMTFPNNRMVQYDHDAGVDYRLGRLTRVRLADGAAFTSVLTPVYAGVGLPVKMTYPQPGLQWTLLAQSGESTSGNKIPYTGLDRFGRIIQARWLTTASTPATRVHVNYWYDRGSRRIWRETPNAPTGNKEAESYLYDGLSQVTRRQRGALERDSQGAILGIAAPPEREEEFAFDTLGNWQQYTVKTPDLANPPAQTTVFDHTRSHNAANQTTGFSNTTQPVTHDPSGNTTQIAPSPAGNWSQSVKFTWDAWNRLIAVHDAATNAELARHAYDGLTRRTWLREGGTSGAVRHFFYNDQWRSIEERLGGSASAERQHLFHPANRWHLVLRDRDTDANGTLDERLYALQDAMDPVAVADTSGAVTERYSYSAFGQRRVMNASFADQSGGTAKAWNWEFHGEFSDSATGLHNYGYRYFSPVLGRWLGRDPIGEEGGVNLLAYLGNTPVSFVDILGTHGNQRAAQRALDHKKVDSELGHKHICGTFTLIDLDPFDISMRPSIRRATGAPKIQRGYEVRFNPDESDPQCKCGSPCELRIIQVISYDDWSDGFEAFPDNVGVHDQKKALAAIKAGFFPVPPSVMNDDNSGRFGDSFIDGPSGKDHDNNTWSVEVCAICVSQSEIVMRNFGCVRFDFGNKEPNRKTRQKGGRPEEELEIHDGESRAYSVPAAEPTGHFKDGYFRFGTDPNYRITQ